MYWVTIKQGYNEINFNVSNKGFIDSLITNLIDANIGVDISIELEKYADQEAVEPEEGGKEGGYV